MSCVIRLLSAYSEPCPAACIDLLTRISVQLAVLEMLVICLLLHCGFDMLPEQLAPSQQASGSTCSFTACMATGTWEELDIAKFDFMELSA